MAAKTNSSASTDSTSDWRLTSLHRCPGVRALAWQGNELYASQGYEVVRGSFHQRSVQWEAVAKFQPTFWRRFTCKNRLTFRLVRDGFHSLVVLPNGGLVGGVPGAIVTLMPGDREFRVTHKIVRGTRPLNIAAVPGGQVYWGEYFDNPARDEVHIYASNDCGRTWQIAYTFLKGAIRHIHNIVYDRWQNCLWILTGDYGAECRILRASCDLKTIDVALAGNQQARAVAMVPSAEGLYFSSDTPLETNHIYHLDRGANLSTLHSLESSSISGCRVGETIFFTTMVEPSKINSNQQVQLYGGRESGPWRSLHAWNKDPWPMRFFQYGNAFLPSGLNTTTLLAVTTVAVQQDDLVTHIFEVR